MSIFNGSIRTEAEMIAEMELAQNTRASVASMLDGAWLNRPVSFVMCSVSNSSKYDTAVKKRVIVSYSRDSKGYISGYKDSDGCTWDYATAINMDGTAMSVYDYQMVRR